ncbi:YhdP family protein [Pseudomonas matsuisoli]|uniref:TIGR02099 family protein n=1 Tax=Pseudomonas matsuisoli TaxID=1515666 RepID=A0A917Q2I3_9PSED|nr:YhdP family protein [Pseudomonas matsuisoli]GGK08074.1 TIGR02099 family protein [Pseudomonas matsuisoli]
MSQPSAFLSRALRVVIAAGAVLIILLALLISLGRLLIPAVAEYRAEIEARIEQAFGLPTHVGALEGSWHGLTPRLVARDVQIGEGENPLRLDALSIELDLPASVIDRQLQLSRLVASGLRLSLREEDSGDWRVEGFPGRAEKKPFDPGPLLAMLQHVGLLALQDAQVTIQPQAGDVLALNYLDLSLSSHGHLQRLDGRALLPDGAPLAFSVQGALAPNDILRSDLRAYLSLPQSDWAQWIPPTLLQQYRLQHLTGGGEVWLDWAQGRVQRAVARLNAAQVAVVHEDKRPVDVRDLGVSAYLDYADTGYRLRLDALAATLEGKRWGETDMLITQRPSGDGEPASWSVVADRIDLAPLTPLALALAPLPAKASEALEAIAPHGAIRNLDLRYIPSAPPEARVQLAANLERVGFGAYHGAPAAENVSGSIAGGLNKGELKVDSDDFMLHLSELFPKPWRYDHAAGRLSWTFDDDAFTLIGHYLRADGPVGNAAGDFLIRLKRDHAQESYMDLRVGLRNGDAAFTADYIPTRAPALSPELAEWLTTAIQGGTVDEGYFQYQGSLSKASPPTARRLMLYAKARDAQLAYQRGWPLLREASGEVFVENAHVRVQAPTGKLLGSRVKDVRVDIAKADDDIVHLKLQGEVSGSVDDALKTLSEAPIPPAERFGEWQGRGPLQGTLDLDIPFRKGMLPKVVVNFETQGATFSTATPDLRFERVAGQFRFDSERGLSTEGVTAVFLGEPVKGQAAAIGRAGDIRSRVTATGNMAWERLAEWLHVDRPLPVSGRIPFLLDLNLGEAGNTLKIDSTLQGVAVDLPAPFGKAPTEARPASFQMTLGQPEQRFWADYDRLANLALRLPGNDWQALQGTLVLGGGQASEPKAPGLALSGHLDAFDLAEWQAVQAKYLSPSQASSAEHTVGAPAPGQGVRRVDLNIDRFTGAGLDIAKLSLLLERATGRWNLTLGSETLAGTAGIPDAKDVPMDIALSRLRLPAAEPPPAADAPVEARKDPLADLDPRTLPPLRVTIDRLLQGDELLGAWSFRATPTPNGAQFDNVDLDLKKGLKLTGSVAWTGPAGASRSHYQGRLEGENLSEVLLAWKFAPTATSEDFRLDVNGNWPGSPAAVSLKSFSGEMDARLRKGAFVEVEGRASALRVFGLLNFNAIGRRLRLDFSDLLGRGLAYDEVKGTLLADRGMYVTRKPITMTGPSTNIEIDGKLDMVNQQIDAQMQVALPLTNNLPLAALIVGAPAIGGALFVVDRLLGDRVARFASVHYKVEGPLLEPKMTFERP